MQFVTIINTHQSDFLEAFLEIPLNTAIPSIALETPPASVNGDDAPCILALYFC